MDACMVCPNRVAGTCGVCGCPVDKKASWDAEDCPDKPSRWKAALPVVAIPSPAPLPFVSCLLPTFGRAPQQLHLLNESVFWFTQQDYPADRRELIILNDAPGQILTCNVPGVRVVKLSERVPTL